MYNQSLEQFYKKIDKRILLVSSYMEDPLLYNIIKSCRLKPITTISEQKFNSKNVVLENIWIDEFGNSLNINNKKCKIILNDLSIDKSKIITTDICFGNSIHKIYSKSKIGFFIIGKDEDLNEDYYVVSLFGNDGYLRTYIYIYGQWSRNYSSLFLGLKNLKLIMSSLDVKYFVDVKNKVEQLYPCTESSAWISSLPESKSFYDSVLSNHKILLNILKGVQI